jgi:hypothetical protein
MWVEQYHWWPLNSQYGQDLLAKTRISASKVVLSNKYHIKVIWDKFEANLNQDFQGMSPLHSFRNFDKAELEAVWSVSGPANSNGRRFIR